MTTAELIDQLNSKIAKWLSLGYISFDEATTMMMYPTTVGMLQLIENKGAISKEAADVIHGLLMSESVDYLERCFKNYTARNN